MRLLVCGDLHLKPAGSGYDLDAVTVPESVDAAVVLGDLTHRAGKDDRELARRVVERLAKSVPVLYVPGNHDHAPMPHRVVEGIDDAESCHRTVRSFDDLTVVGWGCEQRSLPLSIDQREFAALDVSTEPRGERRYAANRTADAIEAACGDVIRGDTSREDAAAELGITREERPTFETTLERISSTYEDLSSLLSGEENVLLASHVPPFNTAFDRHHAIGSREDDLASVHVGSVAIKLVTAEHDTFAALSGHSHSHGYEVGDDGRPHYLNLGFRGIATVDVAPDRGLFSFTRIAGEE